MRVCVRACSWGVGCDCQLTRLTSQVDDKSIILYLAKLKQAHGEKVGAREEAAEAARLAKLSLIHI